MYVHSVKLINFKSIGDYPESEVILEPRVTAIIGKNESGKSNILDGLSRIRFRVRNAAAFNQDIVNRNGSAGKENRYRITLKPSEDDIRFGIYDDTEIDILKLLIDLTQHTTRCSNRSDKSQEYLISRHAAVETES